jgi:hypothetical protein
MGAVDELLAVVPGLDLSSTQALTMLLAAAPKLYAHWAEGLLSEEMAARVAHRIAGESSVTPGDADDLAWNVLRDVGAALGLEGRT